MTDPALPTPALDNVRRLDTANKGLAFVPSESGDLYFVDEVRTAYTADLAAHVGSAVREAREDERRKVLPLITAARKVNYEAICMGYEVDKDLDQSFNELRAALDDYDAQQASDAQPAPGKGTP